MCGGSGAAISHVPMWVMVRMAAPQDPGEGTLSTPCPRAPRGCPAWRPQSTDPGPQTDAQERCPAPSICLPRAWPTGLGAATLPPHRADAESVPPERL